MKNNQSFTNFINRSITDYKILLRNIPSTILLFFVLSIVCANLMANKELFNYKYLALDCGFVFSWIMFLCMDVICKRWGPKASVKISIFALFINLAVCFCFFLLSLTNGSWGESYTFTENSKIINSALNKTFGGSYFVVFGSALAFLISSIVNAFFNFIVGKKIKNHIKEDSFSHFALRSYISTFIAQFVDNFIFAVVISRTFFGWTWKQIIFCSIFGATCELICEICFSGIGFKILQNWDKENIGAEYIDYRKNYKETKAEENENSDNRNK